VVLAGKVTDLSQPIRIGNLEVPNRVFLAPLAGVSDVPFRRICRDMGAGLAFVEMLNANTVIHATRRIRRLTSRHSSEDVLGVQVTGPQAERVAEAVTLLDRQGFDLIDINMGCPVRKIVSRGSGSAILKDLDRLEDTVALSRAATRKPLSVKVRLGFTREETNIEQTSPLVAGAGADMFTIHGRARSERYDVPVDYDGIRAGLERARAVAGPAFVTVGNGDVLNREAAREMVRRTHCDAVMVSRGSLGNPWIFAFIQDEQRPEPNLEEWCDVVMRHLDYHQDFYGEDPYAVVLTRKHLLWYAKGFPEIKRFRDRMSRVKTLDEARSLVREYAATFPGTLRRYENFDDRPLTGGRNAGPERH
jgi:nifR3 family TIM-barrel protein